MKLLSVTYACVLVVLIHRCLFLRCLVRLGFVIGIYANLYQLGIGPTFRPFGCCTNAHWWSCVQLLARWVMSNAAASDDIAAATVAAAAANGIDRRRCCCSCCCRCSGCHYCDNLRCLRIACMLLLQLPLLLQLFRLFCCHCSCHAATAVGTVGRYSTCYAAVSYSCCCCHCCSYRYGCTCRIRKKYFLRTMLVSWSRLRNRAIH